MSIKVAGQEGIEGTTTGLRGVWEATSFQLERLQCDPACVEQEASRGQKQEDLPRGAAEEENLFFALFCFLLT